MAQDVERHCRQCATCQESKLPMPVRSPLTNILIGRPWQMTVIDILEVSISTKNSRYLLVIQYYFTKWADARPDSHKNYSKTGQAVPHIWHPRNRPLRPGSELRKLHCSEHIGCLWGTKKPHNTLSHTRRWNG